MDYWAKAIDKLAGFILLFVITVVGISFLTIPVHSQVQSASQVNFNRHFKQLGVKRTTVIYDLNENEHYQYCSSLPVS